MLEAQRARQRAGARPDWHLIDALQACGDGAIDAGDYRLAADLLTEAEDLARREFGPNSEVHAVVLAVRGRLRVSTIDPRRAYADLTTAVEVLRSGSEEFRRLHLPAALVHLALVEGQLGQISKARVLAHEAYELDLATYGPNHPETLKDAELINTLETLATILAATKPHNRT